MAIVEDEVRNESEEENEIEVVVEEDDAEQDSDNSDDDDEEEEEALEQKVAVLERKLSEDPYNYDDHIELIQALWRLTELERWRSAFERLQSLSLIKSEHWLLRIQTEATLDHSTESRSHIGQLFHDALLDCYSIPILTEWCSWSVGLGVEAAREQMEEVLKRAGADPLSGKLFWDAKFELEKAHLNTLSEDDNSLKEQKKRVLWSLEETVSRPLLRTEEAWSQFHELGLQIHDQQYIDKVQKQHQIALDYLQKITPYEDKLLTTENTEDKCNVYQEYIDAVKELSRDEKYSECDSNGILKVLYDRATTECVSFPLLLSYSRHTHQRSSRSTYWRVLDTCCRRYPRKATFWTLKIQQAEHDEKDFDQIKSIFETALSKVTESFKEAESLWLTYLEYIRRHTAFDNEPDVERLRRTFRLAWDSLAEAWGEEANDSEVPLYWSRIEYKRMKDPKQGKEIFEEIFRYGENKTMSKYWEAFIQLESHRDPPMSENKLRDLHRRGLKFVTDYPPAVAKLWTDYERDYGQLSTLKECVEACEIKIKEWREGYQKLKEKMSNQKQKSKQTHNKFKSDRKTNEDCKKFNKGKRKSHEEQSLDDGKKKRSKKMEMDAGGDTGSSSGVKRPMNDEDNEKDNKRHKNEGDSEVTDLRPEDRDACTLFVSNLQFKVDEQSLRDTLSEFGKIVSLRVRSGVKAFGGSICYCQYHSSDSVDKALKHDRTPLDGRPMFFSRYSASKSKPSFKYATTTERNKLFVKNLPHSYCTKAALSEIFDKYGKLNDVRVVTFKDGKPKGLAYIDYETEKSASDALEKTNGLLVGDRNIEVAISDPPPKPVASTSATLGLPKRDGSGGMRRTQLSSFIPSVLQRNSVNKATTSENGSTSTSAEKQPLSNSDFRNMLLSKK